MDWKADIENYLNPVYIELLHFAEWCGRLPQVRTPTFESNPIVVDRVELLHLLHLAMEEIERLEG